MKNKILLLVVSFILTFRSIIPVSAWSDPQIEAISCLPNFIEVVVSWSDPPTPLNGRTGYLQVDGITYEMETRGEMLVANLPLTSRVIESGEVYGDDPNWLGIIEASVSELPISISCQNSIMESFPYTLTFPGKAVIVWANPDKPYPWNYRAFVDIDTGQGLVELGLSYDHIEQYDTGYVLYFSRDTCIAGRIVSARLESYSYGNVEVYLLGNLLDGLCKHNYLPLTMNRSY